MTNAFNTFPIPLVIYLNTTDCVDSHLYIYWRTNQPKPNIFKKDLAFLGDWSMIVSRGLGNGMLESQRIISMWGFGWGIVSILCYKLDLFLHWTLYYNKRYSLDWVSGNVGWVASSGGPVLELGKQGWLNRTTYYALSLRHLQELFFQCVPIWYHLLLLSQIVLSMWLSASFLW